MSTKCLENHLSRCSTRKTYDAAMEIKALKEMVIPKIPPPSPEMTIEEKKKRPPRRSMNRALMMAVWNFYFGKRNGVGNCFCCKDEVTQQDFEAGHIKSVANGGDDDVSNLQVVCRSCNLSMGKMDMMDFVKKCVNSRHRSGDSVPTPPARGAVPPPWTPLAAL